MQNNQNKPQPTSLPSQQQATQDNPLIKLIMQLNSDPTKAKAMQQALAQMKAQ